MAKDASEQNWQKTFKVVIMSCKFCSDWSVWHGLWAIMVNGGNNLSVWLTDDLLKVVPPKSDNQLKISISNHTITALKHLFILCKFSFKVLESNDLLKKISEHLKSHITHMLQIPLKHVSEQVMLQHHALSDGGFSQHQTLPLMSQPCFQ